MRLVSTGVPSLDAILGRDGCPDRSTGLVIGSAAIGKEVLGYYFGRLGTGMGVLPYAH